MMAASALSATTISNAATRGGRVIAIGRAFARTAVARRVMISGSAVRGAGSILRGIAELRSRGDTKTRSDGASRVIGVNGEAPVGTTSTSRASVQPTASDAARSRSRNRALAVLINAACGSD